MKIKVNYFLNGNLYKKNYKSVDDLPEALRDVTKDPDSFLHWKEKIITHFLVKVKVRKYEEKKLSIIVDVEQSSLSERGLNNFLLIHGLG